LKFYSGRGRARGGLAEGGGAMVMMVLMRLGERSGVTGEGLMLNTSEIKYTELLAPGRPIWALASDGFASVRS
jgi:hypothetical protein